MGVEPGWKYARRIVWKEGSGERKDCRIMQWNEG